MKKIFLVLFVFCAFVVNAQNPSKPPTKAEMDKMMYDAFKKAGMSKEDADKMKAIMKEQGNKPAAQQPINLDDILKDNKQLIPAKNTAKINVAKKQYTAAEVASTVNSMYTKLLAKGDAPQIAMAKKAMAVAKTCTALMDAANTAMLQGQPHTALLLSLKAVQTCGSNLVAQNNLAALLTQYGYPEQSIPFLQKINNEAPGNSTVLNNLAYAWLGLGDTETAYQYAYASVMRNPQHPQSRLLCGVILDAEGKKEEAKQQLEIARKFNTTKLSQVVSKNSGNQQPFITMSWAEIKKRISVYEYFPKGWRKTFIPVQNNIDYYDAYHDGRLSHHNLRLSFRKKMNELIKAKKKINDAEMSDKAGLLKKVMQSGASNQSNFLEIIVNIRVAIANAYRDEYLNNWEKQIQSFRKYRNEQDRNVEGLLHCTHRYTYDGTSYAGHNTESGKKECDQVLCRANTDIMNTERNKRMADYNTQFLAFSEAFEEDNRFYYNAVITWWLIDNSPALQTANEIAALEMIESFFDDNYGFNSDISNLYFQSSRADICKNPPSREWKATDIPHPEIPNLNCPIVFSIPSGFGKLNIGSGVSVGSDNEYGITASGANKSPNMSTSLGTSGSRISEPGLKKDPYLNTGNGTADPALGTPDDEELVPLSKPNDKPKEDEVKDKTPPKPSQVNSSWGDGESSNSKNNDEELKDARNTVRELLDNSVSKTCNTDAEQKTKKKKAEELKEKIEREFRIQRCKQDYEISKQKQLDEVNALPYEERVAMIKQIDIWNRQLNPSDSWYGERMVFHQDLFNDMAKKIAASEERRLKRVADYNKLPQAERERTERLSNYYTNLDAKIKDNLMQTINMYDPKYDVINGVLVEVLKNNGLTPTQNNGLNIPGKIAGFIEGLFN